MTKVYCWNKSATVPTFLHLSLFFSAFFLMGGGEERRRILINKEWFDFFFVFSPEIYASSISVDAGKSIVLCLLTQLNLLQVIAC